MTPKKQKALIALLTQPTKEKAAAAAGITSKTLRGYLDDPAFQAEYRKAFAELVEDATRKVQQTLDPAVAVLREIMEDGGENGQVRVSAARSVLEPVDDLSQSLFEMGKWLAGLDEQGKAELLQSLNEDELSMSAEDLKWFISDYTEV